jgi:hypothetical protein
MMAMVTAVIMFENTTQKENVPSGHRKEHTFISWGDVASRLTVHVLDHNPRELEKPVDIIGSRLLAWITPSVKPHQFK